MKRLALIVTGDRHATDDPGLIAKWNPVLMGKFGPLQVEYDDIVLIHGACGQDEGGRGDMVGIDKISDGLGRKYGFSVIPVPARWRQFGNPAGPRRNTGMLKMQQFLSEHGYERLVLAFHDNISASKGTKDCVRQAGAMGVPVEVIGLTETVSLPPGGSTGGSA